MLLRVVQPAIKGIGRDDDDRQAGPAAGAQPAQGFPAVNAGHGQVQAQGVGCPNVAWRVCSQLRQGFVAPVYRVHPKPQWFEPVAQQLAVGGFVVHHPNGAARAVKTAVDQWLHGRWRQVSYLRQKQTHAEHRALPGGAAHRHFAAHQVGEHAGDGQAQAAAAVARQGAAVGADAIGRTGPGKGLEHLVQFVGAHAGAGVVHFKSGHLPRVAHPQAHAAHLGELDRIAQQVDEYLAQAFFVGTHGRWHRLAQHLEAEAQAFGGGLQLEQAGHFGERARQRHGFDVKRQLARFDAGHVQRALDERQQMFTAALNDVHRLCAVRRHIGVGLQQLGVAQNAVERCAQFVADGADVAGLGLVGGFGGGTGLLQLGVGAAVAVDFLHQQLGLALRLLQGHAPALAVEHQPPAQHSRHQQQHRIHPHKTGLQHIGHTRHGGGGLAQQQRQHGGQQRRSHAHDEQVMRQPGLQRTVPTPGQAALQQRQPLRFQPPVGFAQVVAAGVQRAAERTNRALVGGAMRHVGGFVFALANDANAPRRTGNAPRAACGVTPRPGGNTSGRAKPDPRCSGLTAARCFAAWAVGAAARGWRFFWRSCQVIAAFGEPSDDGGGDQGGEHGQHGREGLGPGAEKAQVGGDGQARGQAHGTHAHRVDVVQIGAPKLDARGR